jgi:hypothetical protein
MKKLIILVFISSLLVISCKKTEKVVPVISNELIDYLFTGLENNISVVLPGIDQDKLIVKVSVGSLTGEKGNYKYLVNDNELKNGDIKTVEFTVLFKDNKGNEVIAGTKTYKIKALPEISLNYGGRGSGEIKLEDILRCDSLNYTVPGFFYNDSIFGQITGYTLTIQSIAKAGKKSDTVTTKYEITGCKFNTAAAEKIIKLKSGDLIEFSDAKILFKGEPKAIKEKLILTFKGNK